MRGKLARTSFNSKNISLADINLLDYAAWIDNYAGIALSKI